MKVSGAVAGKSSLLMPLKVSLKSVGLLTSFGATVRNTLAGPFRWVSAIDSAMEVLCSKAPKVVLRPAVERTGRIWEMMSSASLVFGRSIASLILSGKSLEAMMFPNFWKASGLA